MANDSVTVNLTVTANQTQPRIPLKVPTDAPATKLREMVSEATKIPLSKLRLIFRGKLLGDDPEKKAVEEFKLEDGSVLHCMGKPEASSSASASADPSSAPPAAAGSSVTMMQPNNAAAAAPAAASSNPLQAAFAKLRSSNAPPTYVTAVTTLEKILNNIVNNPMEEKYRRVKKNNAAFQKRLGGLTGGDEAMKAAGFVSETNEGEEVYMMHASAEKWPELLYVKTGEEWAGLEAKAASNQASSAPAQMPNFGNLPGMGAPGGMGAGAGAGFPAGGMGGADMQAAAARMMSDPNAMQAMLSNPMVQNMIRNDPRFANNPMLQQSMEQLASNPQMLQQVSQMMQNPDMMRQMQSMMGGGAGAGGGFPGMPPGGMPNFGAMNPNGTANNSNDGQQQGGSSSNNGADDEAMTEEEMIAEAIRRSLQDGSN